MSGRALVTGAGGFVGRTLCAYLERKGWEVFGTVIHEREVAARRVVCDITREDEVDRLFDWAGNITHVFHLAAISFVPDAQRDPIRTLEVNTSGTMRLLQAVEANAGHACFVNVGSSDVYGPPKWNPVDETHPVDPVNPYAISKAAADAYCGYYQRAHDLDIIRLRPFNHSGPGQSSDFVLSSFARQIATMEAGLVPPVLRVGNLSAARDFTHVDDVVRAYELAALEGEPGEIYNVCSGYVHSIQEAVELLIGLAKVPVTVETDPDRLRPVDVPEICGSSTKFAEATGWRPEIAFEILVKDLLGYWRQQLELDT